MPDEHGDFEIKIIMPYRLVSTTVETENRIWEVQVRQLLSVGEAQFSEE